jgi:hypothetical protein
MAIFADQRRKEGLKFGFSVQPVGEEMYCCQKSKH